MNYAFILERKDHKMSITYGMHRKYKIRMRKILLELYSSRIFFDDILYIGKQKFDNDDNFISIINKCIGNISIINWMYRNFNCNTFSDVIYFLKNNKRDLLLPDGKYFKNILDILINCENKGSENEIKAISYLKKTFKNKDIRIKQTGFCSKEDVVDGIDLIVYYKNKEFYVQVKPLISFKEVGELFKIKSKGKIKIYNKIHYYIFVNKNKCLLFHNRNVSIKNNELYFPKNNIIYNK
jgi:hypothetical protein